MQKLISIAEAEKLVMDSIPLAAVESVALADAYGRVLRQNLCADRSIPPYDRVMMDGIAIDSAEYHGIGSEFIYAGTQAAGSAALEKLLPNTCFEVMTGAVMPSGCDCVVPVEEISREGDSFILSPDADISPNKFVHAEGSDAKQNEILVATNSRLRHPELAIAASIGQVEIEVSRLPLIHIITTGDEVIDPSEAPESHQIRRSHPTALISKIETEKLGRCVHVHLPDDEKDTEHQLQQSLQEADVIILTGGISKGKFDYVAPCLKKLMGEPLFHGVRQKPGKPLAYWKNASGTCIFALPGNPISVLATATRYVFPALRAHLGLTITQQSRELAGSFDWKAPLPGFLPVKSLENGNYEVVPFKNSGDYTCLVGIDGFIQVPDALEDNYYAFWS